MSRIVGSLLPLIRQVYRHLESEQSNVACFRFSRIHARAVEVVTLYRLVAPDARKISESQPRQPWKPRQLDSYVMVPVLD